MRGYQGNQDRQISHLLVPLGSPEPRNESKLQGALVVASPLAEAASQERRTLFDHVSSATQRAR